MYILENKYKLNSFVNSIREQLKDSIKFLAKPAKFKELMSRCLGFNSYANVISNLPMDIEAFQDTFLNALTKALMAEPYSEKVNVNKIKAIHNNAMSLGALGNDLNFSDEINQIKNNRDHSINDEKIKLRQHIKDRFI